MKSYLLIGIIFFLIGCHSVSEKRKFDHPNIILIIADDMNWDDCGAYGHPTIKTPNIDKLAKDGMRFDHAYVTASSCSPSRASIITGKYPHNTGAEQLHWAMPEGTNTFVEALKAAGYFTAAAGKWHMGNHIRHHFDVINEANKAGFQLPTGDSENPPTMIAQQPSGCEDWIPALKARPKDKPFFMWFAALDPHRAYEDGALDPPHQLSDVSVPPHLPDVPEVREDLRQYYDEIGRLDLNVGKVVPNSISKSLVSTVDIAPTICEVTNIEPLASFEGNSFLPVLKDSKKEIRSYIFGEDHWHDYEDHSRAVLNQSWKLIRNDYIDLAATPSADAGRSLTWTAMRQLKAQDKLTPAQLACFITPRPQYELYDLQNDPQELHNLADDPTHTVIKSELLKALDDWSAKTGDYIPTKRTPDEFDRITGEPDHSVRKRPRPDKKAMFGTYGKY